MFVHSRRNRSCRLPAAMLLLAAWLLMWAVASAQTFPPLVGVVSDSTGNLNASQVNDAARSVQALGVKPLAVFASSRAGTTSIDDFGHQAAANYGLINDGVVDPNLFEIAVTLSPREATVVWGDGLAAVMADPPTGQGVAARIRTQYLVPNLAAGDYTKAFVDSFQQAAKAIDLYRNPPTPTVAPTPAPPIINNVDTSGIGSALLWIAGIVILGVALLIIVPLIYRSYRRSQEAAGRRRALAEQLAQGRRVAADMITALDFPADPHEQIQYRFLALTLENERPDQLATLTAQYHDMYNRVADALSRFNDLNNATPTTEAEISNAIAGYQYAQGEITDASAFLAHIADMSKEVERQAAAAPGEVDQAKKALAAATSSIERLAAASPDLYHPKPEITLKPAADALSAAQQALQSTPPRSLHAYDAAATAIGQANAITQAVGSLAQAHDGLTAMRSKINDLRKKGFKLSQADDTLASILTALSTAAKQLEAARPAAFGDALKKATDSTAQLSATIDSTIALHTANEKALADLQAAGEQVKAYIEQGAKVFDQVDEYAESSWHDIRGNGTEAQKAADQAHDLWQQATALNALSPDSPQDFEHVQALITEANSQLDQARKLITAIVDRLKNIQESQRTAQAEIASASRDIQAGQDFISKYDRDITPHPADLLKTAASQLQDAQAEAAKPKPDWIAVVAKARSANDTADKALAEARSQHEAIEARRLKLNTLLQQAQASASRAANFASVHRNDLSPNVLQAVDDATQRLQEGSSISANLEKSKLEDAALSDAYDKVIAALTLSQGNADQAYNDAFVQFNAMENLRANLRTALQQALDRIKEAAEFIGYHNQAISNSPVHLLQRARAAMPTVRDGADPNAIKGYIAAATQARDLASQAYNDARREYDTSQEEQSRRATEAAVNIGANIALGILGSLLSSGARRGGGWSGGSSWGSRGGGWGGGGGGGSSSGGWGGGGSSSGSFGGGGSSGGSWGGGGSSSGGW